MKSGPSWSQVTTSVSPWIAGEAPSPKPLRVCIFPSCFSHSSLPLQVERVEPARAEVGVEPLAVGEQRRARRSCSSGASPRAAPPRGRPCESAACRPCARPRAPRTRAPSGPSRTAPRSSPGRGRPTRSGCRGRGRGRRASSARSSPRPTRAAGRPSGPRRCGAGLATRASSVRRWRGARTPATTAATNARDTRRGETRLPAMKPPGIRDSSLSIATQRPREAARRLRPALTPFHIDLTPS